MRIITEAKDIDQVRSLLPAAILKRNPLWQDVESLSYSFRCDLFYFDVIDTRTIARLPQLLHELEEERCFVFNHESLVAGEKVSNCEIGFEIEQHDKKRDVVNRLDGGDKDRNSYGSVFYLTGLFGIASPSKDWLIYAEPDDRAVFLSMNQKKYESFLRRWWFW